MAPRSQDDGRCFNGLRYCFERRMLHILEQLQHFIALLFRMVLFGIFVARRIHSRCLILPTMFAGKSRELIHYIDATE